MKELTGGGLIRSLGGWAEVSNERFERHYELKQLGYDLDRIASRVYPLQNWQGV